MNPAGELAVSARLDGTRLDDCTVVLKRPPVVRLFLGQPAAAVLKTVPYVYTLCARAQLAAAQAALQAAGESPLVAVPAAELWQEFLHEGLWRLLLDWPATLGLAPERTAFAAWRTCRSDGGDLAQATDALLAGPLADLAERCLAGLPDDDASAPDAWPAFDPDAWLAVWPDAEPLTWPRPGSITAAYRARLADVRRAATALRDGAPYPLIAAGGDGTGVGQVLTARGVLTHAVRVAAGRVDRYTVRAPTDRHFADASGLAELLRPLVCTEPAAARPIVEQAVLALDPCLPYTVEVRHA